MSLINQDHLAIVTIWMEAQGEPYNGKVAVGEVIRTRMKRRYSSDGSIAGTVARRYQFSGWNDSKQENDLLIKALKIDREDEVVWDCIKAWDESRETNLTLGAVLYCNLKIASPVWAVASKFLTKVGQHSFFAD